MAPPPAASMPSNEHIGPAPGSHPRNQPRPNGSEGSLQPPREPLRREPAGKSELRIAKERLYPTPRLRECQPSKRSSPGTGGHVSPDSTALAPPLSTSFLPCQLRVTSSEDTPPRRPQCVKQVRCGY